MPLFGYEDTLRAETGLTEDLAAPLLRAADLLRSTEACLLYVVGRSEDDPRIVRILQVWSSREAHDESLAHPAVRKLIAEVLPLLSEKPSGTTWTLLGGKGLPF